YNVIEAGMLSEEGGLNTWMPIASAANFAQCAACLAVGLKAKNAKTKAVAIPSSLSAALGITEPAIFGVNLRFAKPLVCGIAGGAVGALLGSIMHIGATAYGVTGIPGYLTTLDYALQYTIVLAVSFAIAFALTWIFWKEDEEDAKKASKKRNGENTGNPVEKKDENKQENANEILQNTDENTIYAPLTGNVIPLEQIPDDTFASGVLGNGVGIEPQVGEVVAPFDGSIATITDTKHAIGLAGPNEMELLIHVGIDTVNMQGEGFELYVSEGDTVKAGQRLMTFSIDKIKENGYSTTTAVLLNNSDDYENFKVVKTGAAKKGEPVITI
ncbi:MAG: glucose PTS transporter subunit IIA, partial [Lachnospiraceae bacterium]|nr:glucose PTS transporter subunit IIA [Lachnospiraceae bacterium]